MVKDPMETVSGATSTVVTLGVAGFALRQLNQIPPKKKRKKKVRKKKRRGKKTLRNASDISVFFN